MQTTGSKSVARFRGITRKCPNYEWASQIGHESPCRVAWHLARLMPGRADDKQSSRLRASGSITVCTADLSNIASQPVR
jgi:hypothetical protein